MGKKLIITILIFIALSQFSLCQQETYTVKKAPFSSDKYDEYSPVFYKSGIVFCTNCNSGISNYSNSKNEGLFKLFYIDTVGRTAGRGPKLFSKDLTTKFNDGPVTFSSKGDTIYYSRNLEVKGKLGELSSGRNKLGIFSAVKFGNRWIKITELRINNEWYNVSTPWLSPDGKRLFFSSDRPGGFGGSDLYYCQWKRDYWNDPVNLGPVINTKGNEAYPFVDPAGELFFSSDGHPGFGGKDIFFSRFADTAWLPPVRLDPPINSEHDDFGIITDTLMNEGYFSSNRNKSIDIYYFKTNYPQIFYSNIQRENQYCFMFNDSGLIDVDTTNLQLKWYFGDGKSADGAIVKHCFLGPENYNVRLNIVERSTGKLFFIKLSYILELRDFEQPYINSPDVAVKGDVIDFDGLRSNLPGYRILNYSWDFGDGNRSSVLNVSHSFKEKGEYIVKLELTIRSDSTGNIQRTSVSKKISIFNDKQGKDFFLAKRASVKAELYDVRNYESAKIKTQYSAEIEYQQDVVFRVELLSSKNRVSINSPVFRNLPKKYTLKEKFNPDDGTYSYTVDQQISLMATYPAYWEMIGLGFKDARIKIFVLSDPSEKEIYNLIKIYGVNAESYFDPSDRLTSSAYIMLDQIVKLMNNYPSMKLEIAVHSDNTGSEENNLALTQRRSQVLVNYIINRGISKNRLVATGFGESKPIAPNFLGKDRKLNRRIDFIVISK
jgi:outer membrane protein OmpA-like peptidoglycan-associated protein